MNFTIPFINDALGSSVIYEEYKGDFARARQIAEESLKDARRSNNSAALADALLARGVVHLLQGEPVAAVECFEEIERLVPKRDHERRLRAISYSNLAMYMRFVAFPGGSSADSSEIYVRFMSSFSAYTIDLLERRENLLGHVEDIALSLETGLVYDMLSNVFLHRSTMDTQNVTKEEVEQKLGEALRVPMSFRKQAEEMGAVPGLLAYADLVIADFYRRAGQYEPAQQFLSHAYITYSETGDLAGAATSRMIWGDWQVAPFSTPVVWNHAIQESGSGYALSWTLEAAEFDRSKINITAAQTAYAESERLFGAAGAKRGMAALQLRYGYIAMLKGDYNSAADHAKRAIEGFEKCGDRLGYWVARVHCALSSIGAGQSPEDITTASAIGVWGRTEGSFSYALGLGLLFSRAGRGWLISEGNYERALACYRLAKVLYEALGANTNAAMSLVHQGEAYMAVGERTAALILYEQALEMYEQEIGAPPEIAQMRKHQSIFLFGNIYELYRDDMDADGMERSAARIQAQVDKLPAGGNDQFDGTVIPWLLRNLGYSIVEMARVECPLTRAEQARDAGDMTTANSLFAAALTAARTSSPENRNLLEFEVLAVQKDYKQAVAAFQSFLAQGAADAVLREKLYAIEAMPGEDSSQIEARHQQERYEEAFTSMVRCKAYAEAKPYLEALEQSAGSDWWKRNDRPWQPLKDCGEMYEGLGNLETALDCYDKAINELEERRYLLSRDELKKALAADKGSQYLYFQAARTALKLQAEAEVRGDIVQAKMYFDRAFGYAEHGKARALLDMMVGSTVLAGSSRTESQAMSTWRQLNAQLTLWRGLLAGEMNKREPEKSDPNRIAYLSQQIKNDEEKLRQAEVELAASDPNFHRVISPQSRIMSLDEVSNTLQPGTALLQYYFLGDDMLAWAITREGAVQTHMAAVDTRALERQISTFHSACEGRGTLEELGSELAATFLNPFVKVIQANSKLIMVPYGAANMLPFHALPWEGKPLAATHIISYLPSASTLQFLYSGSKNKIPERILAVGNPSHMAYQPPQGGEIESVSTLPAAEIEAAFVASLLPQSKTLIGEQATEPAVRNYIADYPILHFATHGYLSEDAPLLSSILLAEGEALSVYELTGLRLNADLVVLSACRTALGKITGGDDVLGLTQGLLGAGARAAVVSLWQVNDISTSLFMGEFYGRLGAGDSPDIALQAAQKYLRNLSPEDIKAELDKLKVRLENAGIDAAAVHTVNNANAARDTRRVGMPTEQADYSHPFYWAPFILVGR